MAFNFLDMTNQLLMIMKRTPITSFSSTTNADEFRARTSINAVVQDLGVVLRIKTRQTTFEITTVSAQRLYTVQKRIVYPFGDLRQKISNLTIVPMNPIEFDRFHPNDESRGTPEVHYFEKFSGVTNQPATAGEVVYAVSSSGSDNSQVVVQGYDTNDNYVADEITLSGASAVASTSTFKVIESVSKIATTGTITFRNLGSTTTYETLSPKETSTRRLTIGLHPIPDNAITVFGRGWIQVPELVNEYDLPIGFSHEHINAIMAGGLFHFQKYEPSFKRESLQGLKQDYYDEVQKIIAQDVNDKVVYRMTTGYRNKISEFLPLSRNFFR
ncbi:MAG TPA: hypothetical protein ENH82_05275 [bacterium]|nr:hypothetical protein [bacterium]